MNSANAWFNLLASFEFCHVLCVSEKPPLWLAVSVFAGFSLRIFHNLINDVTLFKSVG